MHWETKDGKYKITVEDLDGVQYYRLTAFPGRYYLGDYRTLDDLRAAILQIDLADLRPVED